MENEEDTDDKVIVIDDENPPPAHADYEELDNEPEQDSSMEHGGEDW